MNCISSSAFKNRFLPGSIALLTVALGLCSCTGDGARYPDPTRETQIKADDIRADAERRRNKIDSDLAQAEQALDFRATQAKSVGDHEAAQITLDRDQSVQPLAAQEREVTAAAAREQTRSDEELAAKLKPAAGPEADRLRAEALVHKAALDQQLGEDIAKLHTKQEKAETTAREKRIAVDERQAKDLATIQREREEIERKARTDLLAIDGETTKRLDALGKDSKERMAKSSAVEGDLLAKDRSIDAAVRKILDADREHTTAIAASTHNGVVTVTGTIADDRIHRDVVSQISKLSDVVSVDDRLRAP
jgi:osmotically-inducible protein OsmY